jgi:hypothetical protein
VYGDRGVWSLHRDRPARTWITEGAPGWWTVVVANWEDEPAEVRVPIATLGCTGTRFAVYDVWRDAPLADVTEALAATLAPHSALTLALRGALPRPQVIGTTRHVVQGAVDIGAESWDPATRTLRAHSSTLDGRAYAVTIAVPPGMRPAGCTADLPCAVRRLESGHVVLAWAPADRRDIAWQVRFKPSLPARRARP